MARRETGQEHIRKLQRTGEGGKSYMVTIPKAIVKKLGWRERQKVEVEEKAGEIIIKDWNE